MSFFLSLQHKILVICLLPNTMKEFSQYCHFVGINRRRKFGGREKHTVAEGFDMVRTARILVRRDDADTYL